MIGETFKNYTEFETKFNIYIKKFGKVHNIINSWSVEQWIKNSKKAYKVRNLIKRFKYESITIGCEFGQRRLLKEKNTNKTSFTKKIGCSFILKLKCDLKKLIVIALEFPILENLFLVLGKYKILENFTRNQNFSRNFSFYFLKK